MINGFKAIPNFSLYAVNELGTMINIVTNKIKTWSVTKEVKLSGKRAGYKYTQCVDDSGKTRIIYQHRIIGMLFVDGYKDGLIINHKDGNKSNNAKSNLEWVTYSENNKHAWDTGLKDNPSKFVKVLNLITKEIKEYRSKRDASQALGEQTTHYVSSRISTHNDGVLFPDLLLFKMNDDNDWIIPNLESISGITGDNPIIGTYVLTKQIVVLDTVENGSMHTGVPIGAILDHARNNKPIPYKGWCFRYAYFVNTIPRFNIKQLKSIEAQLDKIGHLSSGVDCFDHENNTEHFYPTIKMCCEDLGVNVDHFNTLIFTGRRFKERWSFSLVKLR